MGCGASIDDGVPNGLSSGKTSKIKVKRPRRFDAKSGLHDAFSKHARLSMYMLFAHYDFDASGQIDANELYQMMLDALPMHAKNKEYDDDDFDLLAVALDDVDSPVPTLEDVHDMMYAIGVEPTEKVTLTLHREAVEDFTRMEVM